MTVQRTVRLSPDLSKALDKAAADHGVTLSAVVEALLRAGLAMPQIATQTHRGRPRLAGGPRQRFYLGWERIEFLRAAAVASNMSLDEWVISVIGEGCSIKARNLWVPGDESAEAMALELGREADKVRVANGG